MATQITATLPTLDFPREVDYPTQEDWAAFSAAAELNFGILGNDWSTQMQLWKDQANAMSIELNNSADIAQSTVNYKGDWISQGYALNESVSVSGIYYICKLTHATGQNPTAVGSIYWNLAIGNWNLKVDTNMSGYTSKTTPVDADLLALSDSTSTFRIKKLSWANLKATLKTYFDMLYVALTGDQTISGVKTFTSSPIVPTPTARDNSTKVATTAYVDRKMVLGTAVNTTSGTSVDFIGIPSWAKRITVMLKGVSTNGSSVVQVQLGSVSGIETSGYQSIATVSTNITSTSGLVIFGNTSSDTRNGVMQITYMGDMVWMSFGANGSTNTANSASLSGSKTLSGTLDRVRITTVNGNDTFDAGSINIIYEG